MLLDIVPLGGGFRFRLGVRDGSVHWARIGWKEEGATNKPKIAS
jgi:hypothetical protein